ncbi:serine/threonine-protein kinase HipA [Enhydrobacter aerosaccus]|uniref:Serine/threonine-protein kinase HipA n=1 Tax=Enhydrobacter aerosaccus TaxID=225324 RepID=A0A1T4SRM0_9HYPH|nr:type II toxin-antitoxin system HipA family toxin [Enhydrobacter aerosaccus]SKA30827.1 serine/threonine-protein kinase HipA [Enhydrobacter aerosaccus]
MTADRLVAIAEDQIIAEIGRTTKSGRWSLAYTPSWLDEPTAYPLSLSMPLDAADYPHSKVEPWFWGLLPDNDLILSRWASRFHVSPRNPFALLGHVGEDCAGAIQLVSPEKVDAILARRGAVQWLSEADIAERLRTLKTDPSAWRRSSDTGQFSLAGAQPKTALIHRGGRWGIPSGRTPTTHILKPPNDAFAGHAENEHVCLQLAAALGLPTAESTVMRFDGEIAIVVERYDRIRSGREIRRVHQEDLGQALGCPPARKYQNQGGPSAKDIIDFLRTHSASPTDDVWTFVQALGFNWLIGGTDAHAKNYSMLIGAEGYARLAPLYDVATALPYDFDRKKLKLAMSIGGEYRLDAIGWRKWAKFCDQVRLPKEEVHARLTSLADALREHLPAVIEESVRAGLDRKALRTISTALKRRADECARELAS